VKGGWNMGKKYIRFIIYLLTAVLLLPSIVWADAHEAYDALTQAQMITHRDGPFRFRGEAVAAFNESNNGIMQTTQRHYRITGYNKNAGETMLQFETRHTAAPEVTAFLIKQDGLYTGNNNKWESVEIMEILPRFISMGVLDQFFLLEILNGNRLHIYTDYFSFGEDKVIGGETYQAVKAAIDKEQFAELAGALTDDIAELLGDAVKGMSELQLLLIQRFVKGIFTGLDAEGSFTFYIQPSTGRIIQIETKMDMVNPYGSRIPGANPRVKTESAWRLSDFGKEIKN
jgi:hypothetical protein